MLQHIENLKLISVLRGTTNPSNLHTAYPHRLILRLSGTVRYHLPHQQLVLGPGDTLFLPNSPTYHGEILTPGPATYILVSFEGDLSGTPSEGYVIGGQTELHHLFTQLYRSWSVHTPANHCRCMALLYELLSHFADADRHSSLPASCLEPALDYLEQHMFDPTLRIGELHTLCGISDTYFRRLFLSRFGVSPKRYVTDRRLTQAKAILDSGEFSSIAETALTTGFDDALYFSKAFKNKYGYPPSAK